jgi:hypothetical protein
MKFDTESAATVKAVAMQTKEWASGEGTTYVVVDDCGPCVVAAFTFQHHAEAALTAFGQECYLVGNNGKELDE